MYDVAYGTVFEVRFFVAALSHFTMVTPSRTTSHSAAVRGKESSPWSYYIAIAVKILLVLIILFMLPKLVSGGNNKAQRRRKLSELRLRTLRWDCQNERPECALLIPEESLNCVNQCISPACFESIFAANPLEDGEVDFQRADKFEACAHEELRTLRQQLKQLKEDAVQHE